MLRFLVSLVIFNVLVFTKAQTTGKFWHISDLHLDFYYDLNSPQEVCPSSFGADTPNAGPWGDYRCDSPIKLITSAIDTMVAKEPNPDFIIWTGDDTLHTNDEEKYLGEKLVLEVISNLTNLIQTAFPQTKVFSALGNHDYHPKSQFPAKPNSIISSVADMWKPWLTDAQYEQFNITGYYSGSVTGFPGLNIVVLNTNIWYTSNKVVSGTGDPNNHFQWLENVLSDIRASKEKTYIIGHIPPGYFELVDYKYWYYEDYNARYVEIIRKFSDVIVGQFFGHHHTDTYRMFYDEDGAPISSLMITPGVTPWMTTLPQADNGANNPGIRLFEFDKTTFVPKDYQQYYLNLEEANKQNQATWKEEYKATTAYGIPDLSHSSLHALSEKLKNADVSCQDCTNNILMQKFFLYNSVSYNKIYCDEDCQRLQVCAVKEVEYEQYRKCVQNVAIRNLFSYTLVTIVAVINVLYIFIS